MDFSMIELIFYTIIELVSFGVLVVSVITPPQSTKKQAVMRAIFLIPGMIISGLLAQSFPQRIFSETIHGNGTSTGINGTLVFSNMTQAGVTTLGNPAIFAMVHFLLFIVLALYIFWTLMTMLVWSNDD